MYKTIKVTGLLALSFILPNTVGAADNAATHMITDTCVACHGDEGNSVGPAIPNLSGMSPNYMMAAMLAYKYDDEDELEEVIDSDPDFEDVEIFPRYSTIMGRIAKGYTEEEIKMIAGYFSNLTPKFPTQTYDSELASAGAELHELHCEKCHENEGRSAEDDTGILAGQWKPYFLYTMHDFVSGQRAMPKKMKKELDEIAEAVGDDGIKQLAEYYASISE